MLIAVMGGTGALAAELMAELCARGHEVGRGVADAAIDLGGAGGPAAAGAGHLVALSLVGADRLPEHAARERAVKAGRVPWSIVRATRRHDELDRTFRAAARRGVLPGPDVPLQPVDARELAVVLADTVEAEPSEGVTEFAGPEIATVAELAETWRLETGRWRPILPVPVTRAALRDGALVNRGAWRGRITFGAWLSGAPAVAMAL
jgi:uncharacterized protein YbjT (DUF2867 family)